MVGNRSLPQGSVAQCNPSLFLTSPFSQTAEDCWAALCRELVSPRSAGPRLGISYFAGLLCTEKGPSPVSTCIPTAKLSRSTWTYATVTDVRRFSFAPCVFPCSPPHIHHKPHGKCSLIFRDNMKWWESSPVPAAPLKQFFCWLSVVAPNHLTCSFLNLQCLPR